MFMQIHFGTKMCPETQKVIIDKKKKKGSCPPLTTDNCKK